MLFNFAPFISSLLFYSAWKFFGTIFIYCGMEIIFLFCLYYLSQHPDFPNAMKPLLSSLKNSEEMLKFMNELSNFSEMFSFFNSKSSDKDNATKPSQPQTPSQPTTPPTTAKTESYSSKAEKEQEKNSPTATEGIADEFIERCLQNYFKNR